eukprot:scpid80847/ scgid16418/ 
MDCVDRGVANVCSVDSISRTATPTIDCTLNSNNQHNPLTPEERIRSETPIAGGECHSGPTQGRIKFSSSVSFPQHALRQMLMNEAQSVSLSTICTANRDLKLCVGQYYDFRDFVSTTFEGYQRLKAELVRHAFAFTFTELTRSPRIADASEFFVLHAEDVTVDDLEEMVHLHAALTAGTAESQSNRGPLHRHIPWRLSLPISAVAQLCAYFACNGGGGLALYESLVYNSRCACNPSHLFQCGDHVDGTEQPCCTGCAQSRVCSAPGDAHARSSHHQYCTPPHAMEASESFDCCHSYNNGDAPDDDTSTINGEQTPCRCSHTGSMPYPTVGQDSSAFAEAYACAVPSPVSPARSERDSGASGMDPTCNDSTGTDMG